MTQRKAMGVPVGVVRMVMGDDGSPHGVVGVRTATGVKPSAVREEMPVPPMTAVRMGCS